MTDLATPDQVKPPELRPPIGLLLSIGDLTTNARGVEHPTSIDHFRAKPGQLEQYADAAEKFNEVYGEDPKRLDDIVFLSNSIGRILDIRLMAWGTSGVRIEGGTNYALEENWERAFDFDDDVLFFPLDVSELAKAEQASWKGEPIQDRLNGRGDYRIEKYAINVEATFSFYLPRVLGLGSSAQITTKSRNSTRNLFTTIWDFYRIFNGQLAGMAFRLSVRPKRTRYFDAGKKQWKQTIVQELVLDTPFNLEELFEQMRVRREALAAPDRLALPSGDGAGGNGEAATATAESRLLASALDLPPSADEDVQLREEPSERPSDAQLNRIAALEQEIGDGALVTLKGVFGVDTADQLGHVEAERYELILINATAEDGGEVEVVESPPDAEPVLFDFGAAAEEAQARKGGK